MRPGGEGEEEVPCQGGCDITRHGWHRESPGEDCVGLVEIKDKQQLIGLILTT